MKYDVIVVGGGHNGLAAAITLQASGARVAVVEKRSVFGGLCAARALGADYRLPGVHSQTDLVRPWVEDVLGLGGLERGERPQPLCLSRGQATFVLDSAEGSLEFRASMGRLAKFLGKLLDTAPPALNPGRLREFLSAGSTGLALRRLGKADMHELLRMGPMSLDDLLPEYFSDVPSQVAHALPAVLGSHMGPRSPGSAINLLLSEAARTRPIRGGPSQLVAALVDRARALGVELVADAEVQEILMEDGCAAGVVLDAGTKMRADAVLSTVDPKQTMLELVPPGLLPMREEQAYLALRARGAVAKVHLALNGPLEYLDGHRAEYAVVADDLDAIEKAFDAIKYRQISATPVLEVSVPSVTDPGLAPEGHEVVSIVVGYVPHALEGGWNEAAKATVLERTLQTLGRYAPKLKERLVHSEVLSPPDLETEFRLHGGHMFHIEQSIEQLLFMRPTHSAAQYASPVQSLFLGGSGSHPGGGVRCVPGILAARALRSQR